MRVAQPSKQLWRFRETVRELGSVLSSRPAVIHHVVGRTAVHRKVAIGHWWILPLADDEHRMLHSHRWALEEQALGFIMGSRWDFEKLMWSRVLQQLEEQPPQDVIDSIYSYPRQR